MAAIDDEAHLENTRRTNDAGMKLFADAFKELGLDYVPSYANFILVKTGAGRKVFQELQKRKVIVRPMDGYKLPEWIRITIGTPAQNEKVLAELK